MKKSYLLILFLFLLYSCNSDDKKESENIKIEKRYTYYQSSLSINDTDDNIKELFNQKSFQINSIDDLENNPLFDYFTNYFKEEFYKCDFENYTLIVTSSSTLHKISYVNYNLVYNTNEKEYVYFQNLKCAPLEDPVMDIYCLINCFLIKKIPDNSKIIFNTAITII